MPIYAYRCEACGHAQDVLRKISDPLLSTCPACGADRFRKQVTSAGFQLKGSGWYATDFRNAGGAPKPAASEGAGATASAEADGAKAGAEPKASPAAGEGAAAPAAPAAPKAPPAAAPAASPAAPAR